MRKRRLAACAGALLVIVPLVLWALPASSQQPGQRTTLTVFDPRKTPFDKDINEGGKGFGPGDWNVFRENFLDPETCEDAGFVIGRFTFVKPIGRENGLFLLDGGAFLPDGKITFYANGRFSEFENPDTGLLAVTGGTDVYKDATGEIRFSERQPLCDTRGELITIDLLLP
jgi:hypothetical protein